MNTFTAQDMQNYGDYVANLNSAMLSPNFEKWCKERFEPKKKVIDLSVLIDSQIDCEFSRDKIKWRVGKLIDVVYRGDTDEISHYSCDGGHQYKYCRPRMNHKHAWYGGECPIKGFVVRAWVDKEDFLTVHTSSNSINWSKIMYVEFLEVEDGYVMPYGGQLCTT